MKNKILSLLLVSAMAVTMLAGCGSKPAETPDEPDQGTEQETPDEGTETPDEGAETPDEGGDAEAKNPVTLKTVSMFGGTDANAGTYQAINEQLMKDYDYITIEDNSQPSDEDWKAAVAADFSVGNEPDVLQFFTDATANEIVATEKLVSIDEIRAEYPEYAGDILDSALAAAANVDGVSRAVPTTGYWEGLFCNKDLFEQYDVALPTDWASMETAIKTFKENGIIPIACSLNNVPHYWIEFLMLYAAGPQEYTSIPGEGVVPEGWAKGLAMFKTLRDMGAFPEDTDTVDDAYTAQLFKDKKAAMQLDGSWYSGQVVEAGNADTTVVIPFPGIPEQVAEPNTMVAGLSSGFYITRKAWDDPDKRDAAVKFVMAHTSQESIQKYWEATGAIAQAAAEVTPVEMETELAKSIFEYTGSASAIALPTDARIGNAYKTLVSLIVKVSTGEMTPEEAITETMTVYAEQ